MVHFSGFAFCAYVFSAKYPFGWVSPFGNPRVKASLPLSEAYRSLARPSSPDVAKASACCPSLFDGQRRLKGWYSLRVSIGRSVLCLRFIVIPQRIKLSKNESGWLPLIGEQRNRAYRWWAQVDLNHRPRAYQARALTS